jgi:hypothetical protein
LRAAKADGIVRLQQTPERENMSAHEKVEQSEHIEHAAHSNRSIALLIAVLALFLAFSETLGKSAQTAAISYNVEASNLWAFFQAKTVRRTTVLTAAEAMKIATAATVDETVKAAAAKQIDDWQKTAARYRSEPDTREGTAELSARAKEAEHHRETAMAKYHHFEIASAAFQIGIVLASATIITGMIVLSWISGGLGIIGLAFMAIGIFAPHAVHIV